MASIRTRNSATRQFALLAGAAALVGMGALSACSSDTKDKPAETTAPVQSAPAITPTEKAANPGVNNSFAPSVKAGTAPSALPGNIVTGG